jgi:hypothetical protein
MNTTAMVAKQFDSRQQTVERSAVETAFMLLHQPALMRRITKNDIPADVLILLKVSGGAADLAEDLSLQHNMEPADVVTAARLYLQCILTNAGSNDRRMLCLPEAAGAEEIREHKKWLLKWLHPDRNHDSWESALFLQVNDAFNRLQLSPQGSAERPVQPIAPLRRRHGDRRGKHQPSAYVKLNRRGLIGHAAKPILLMVGMVMLTCAVLVTLAIHWATLRNFVSSFAF